MSLVSNISAVVTQIGTAIKALQGRADALEKGVLASIVYTGDHTAVTADAGSEARMNVATANTFTVDPTTLVAGSIGVVTQVGTGQTTLAVASGSVENGGATLKLAQQGASAYWHVISSTLVSFHGELASS